MRNNIRIWFNIAIILTGVALATVPEYRSWKSQQKAEARVEKLKVVETDKSTGEKEVRYEGQVLVIDKIDLIMPIANGVSEENLEDSTATITHNRVEIGKNFTIAGHRLARGQRQFSRLDELEKGDIIAVWEDGEKYEFQVTDKFVVDPEEVEVLEDSGKTEVTLVTCHPPGISTQRLIVKGILKQ